MICPECVAGKHGNCHGDAWDNDTDERVDCACALDGHGRDRRDERARAENARFTRLAVSVECERCGARPGVECSTPSGNEAGLHANRMHYADAVEEEEAAHERINAYARILAETLARYDLVIVPRSAVAS